MKQSFLICLVVVSCTTHTFHVDYAFTEHLVNQLEGALNKIDSLKGYGGPVTSLHGLETWISFIISSVEENRKDSLHRASVLAERLFSRLPYNDNTHRSRIYRTAQTLLVTQLTKTNLGSALLETLQQRKPILTELYRVR